MLLSGKFKLLITLVLVLVTLNLSVGILAYRNLGQIDRDYTRLVERVIPFEDSMRTVGQQASRTLAHTLFYSHDRVPQAERMTAIKQSGAVSDRIFELMKDSPFPTEVLRQQFMVVRAKRLLWRSCLVTYVDLILEGKREEAATQLGERLYPALIDYLNALDGYCDDYQHEYVQMNNELSNEVNASRQFVFGLSLLPTLLLLVLPLTILALLVVFIVIVIAKPACHAKSKLDDKLDVYF